MIIVSKFERLEGGEILIEFSLGGVAHATKIKNSNHRIQSEEWFRDFLFNVGVMSKFGQDLQRLLKGERLIFPIVYEIDDIEKSANLLSGLKSGNDPAIAIREFHS